MAEAQDSAWPPELILPSHSAAAHSSVDNDERREELPPAFLAISLRLPPLAYALLIDGVAPESVNASELLHSLKLPAHVLENAKAVLMEESHGISDTLGKHSNAAQMDYAAAAAAACAYKGKGFRLDARACERLRHCCDTRIRANADR